MKTIKSLLFREVELMETERPRRAGAGRGVTSI